MPEAFAERAAATIRSIAADVCALHGSAVVAVAGGGTMRPVFGALAEATRARGLDWSGVTFIWVDERRVPYSSPGSNYGNALRAGLDRLTKASLLPMPVAGDPDEDARSYERAVRGLLKTRSARMRPIDVAVLGVGADGHVASLFPGSPALGERRRWVVPAAAPSDPRERLTLTLPPLRSSRVRLVVATGSAKRWIVARARRGPGAGDRLPIDEIVTARGRTEWFVDAAAASVPLEQ